MNKKIKLSILVFLSIILALTIKSKSAYKSTDPTVTSGQDFTITVTSTTNLQNFDLSLSSYAGLTYLRCSNPSEAAVVNSAKGNISYASMGSGTTTLGIYSFKAPEVNQKTTFRVVFSINNTTNTSVVTVNPSSGGNTASGTTNSSGNNNQSNTSQQPSTTKSNNATLRELGIRPNDFKGFNRNKLSYNVIVPYETESVEVYAKKGHDKQTISGTGTKKLNVGSNKVDVVVIAEDGIAKKIYTINITRKEKADSNNNTTDDNEIDEEEPEEIGFGLSELTIKGIDLEPQFQTDIYEYRIELKEDLDKLDLSTLATEIGTEIEIMGNENLQEGENVITIIVKGEDEDKNATYQIIVNKTIKKAEAKNNDNNMKKMLIIGGTIVAGVIILIILIIIARKRRLEKIEEEDEEFSQYNNININDIYKESIQNTFDEEDGDYERKRKNSKGKRYK